MSQLSDDRTPQQLRNALRDMTMQRDNWRSRAAADDKVYVDLRRTIYRLEQQVKRQHRVIQGVAKALLKIVAKETK